MAKLSKELQEVKDSLNEQLKQKNANVSHFEKLVDDYIWYCVQENKMKADIEKRGFYIKVPSSAGKECVKDNPCVKQSIMYNKQKLAILKQMDLTVTNTVKVDGDDAL